MKPKNAKRLTVVLNSANDVGEAAGKRITNRLCNLTGWTNYRIARILLLGGATVAAVDALHRMQVGSPWMAAFQALGLLWCVAVVRRALDMYRRWEDAWGYTGAATIPWDPDELHQFVIFRLWLIWTPVVFGLIPLASGQWFTVAADVGLVSMGLSGYVLLQPRPPTRSVFRRAYDKVRDTIVVHAPVPVPVGI